MSRKSTGPTAVEPTKPKAPKDAEIDLMRLIWRKLAAIEPEARRRVCNYLNDRADEPMPAQASLPLEGCAE